MALELTANGSFELEVSLGSDRVVVAVHGDVDQMCAEDLCRCVDAAVVLGEPVELDLGAVSFFGAAAVGALVRLGRTHGRQVRRGRSSWAVVRTLELCGLPELLT